MPLPEPGCMATAIMVEPGAGSVLSKLATGRSEATRRTAMPEAGSLPTSSAGVRVPSDPSKEMDRAPAMAAAVVAMMPPDSAMTPVAIESPDGRVTVSAASDGRTVTAVLSIWVRSARLAVPGSVVGGAVAAARLDAVVGRGRGRSRPGTPRRWPAPGRRRGGRRPRRPRHRPRSTGWAGFDPGSRPGWPRLPWPMPPRKGAARGGRRGRSIPGCDPGTRHRGRGRPRPSPCPPVCLHSPT